MARDDRSNRTDNLARPDHPRLSRIVIGVGRAGDRLLGLGCHVQAVAEETPPAAGRIVAVTNPEDTAVNNAFFFNIIDLWKATGYPVETYSFPAELALPHDVIEPNHPKTITDFKSLWNRFQQINSIFPETETTALLGQSGQSFRENEMHRCLYPFRIFT